MKIIEHAREGLANLYYSKLRSILALLGVLVGSASVVAMVLGGELATNEALRQFKSLGTDLLALSINIPADDNSHAALGLSNNITLQQALDIRKADPQIDMVAPYTPLFNSILYNGESINAMILGVTDSFADIVHLKLQSGRFVSVLDGYSFYCVVGQDVYNNLIKISHRNPIGQQLQIGKNIFIIIGVAEHWPENNFVYANVDSSILIPSLASTALSKYATLNTMILRLKPNADIPKVEEHISSYIDSVVSGKQVMYRSAKELIMKMRKQSDILTVFLGLIGSVSLIVGGIGVMNIMLVSVVERKREIGIRLAVGAKRKDIAAMFLLESIMLSLLGGVLGVIIGIVIAYVIALFWHWHFMLFLWPPLAGFSVSVAVGIFFGFYPAYLASRLNPIDALKAD